MALRFPFQPRISPIWLFFGVAFAGIGLGLFMAHWQWREEMMRGGESPASPVRLYYGKKPARLVAPESLTGKALGADFAEVYVAALARRDMQETGTTDLKEFRPVAYPPFTLWLYGWFRGVPYAQTLSIHSLVSLGTFLLAIAAVFAVSRVGRYIPAVAILTLAVCFYTPAGFSHYERGQFDLYTSTAIFLCLAVAFLDKGRAAAGLAGGFFAAIKLSSLPFLGTFSLAAALSDARGRRIAYLFAPAMVALSLTLFAPELGRLLNALDHMEWAAAFGKVPAGERQAIRGVSFLLILPSLLAKSIQILSMIAFITAARLGRFTEQERPLRFQSSVFPFALAMVIQGMAYGAGSWEYRIVALLGTAAAFVLWVEKVPGWNVLKSACGLAFAVFLIISSRAFHFLIWPKTSWQAPGMSAVYLAFSLLFLAASLGILLSNPRREPEAEASNPLAAAAS